MRENSPLMMLQYTIKVTWASTFVLTELNTRKHVQLCRARHVYSTAMTQHQTSVLKLCFQSQRKLNKKLPKEASWSEMSSAQMDPHDKMRSRDVSKVARGQQAPRPAHAPGTVSPPPQNEATFRAKRGEDSGGETDSARDELFPVTNETRHCFNRYMQYHR